MHVVPRVRPLDGFWGGAGSKTDRRWLAPGLLRFEMGIFSQMSVKIGESCEPRIFQLQFVTTVARDVGFSCFTDPAPPHRLVSIENGAPPPPRSCTASPDIGTAKRSIPYIFLATREKSSRLFLLPSPPRKSMDLSSSEVSWHVLL